MQHLAFPFVRASAIPKALLFTRADPYFLPVFIGDCVSCAADAVFIYATSIKTAKAKKEWKSALLLASLPLSSLPFFPLAMILTKRTDASFDAGTNVDDILTRIRESKVQGLEESTQ